MAVESSPCKDPKASALHIEAPAPWLLQSEATQPGHYLHVAGGLLPAAKGTAADSTVASGSSSCGGGAAEHAAAPAAEQASTLKVARDGRGSEIAGGGSGSGGGSGGGASIPPAEPELYISYIADGGLINQAVSHFGAIAAAIALGAKGVVRLCPVSSSNRTQNTAYPAVLPSCLLHVCALCTTSLACAGPLACNIVGDAAHIATLGVGHHDPVQILGIATWHGIHCRRKHIFVHCTAEGAAGAAPHLPDRRLRDLLQMIEVAAREVTFAGSERATMCCR